MQRREFLQLLAFGLSSGVLKNTWAKDPYEIPRFGKVHLLHFTDCHGQLLPTWFREPDTNLGVGASVGKPPHLTGEALLRHFRVRRGIAAAPASTHRNFVPPPHSYRKGGGSPHLA